MEDQRLRQAAKFLEDDVATFDAFLKENDMNSVHAIKIAENETKAKLEKAVEIKRISGKMVAVKSEISKMEEILKEFNMYHDFLLKLSPPEWQQRQSEREEKARLMEAALKEEKEREAPEEKEKPTTKAARSRENLSKDRETPAGNDPRLPRGSTKEAPAPKVDASKLEELKVPELYFTEPQQMLDVLTELEQQNLTLIQHSRETEETLDEFRVSMDKSRRKIELESQHLLQEINIMTHGIRREQERSAELELKARLFSFGMYKAEDQDGTLDRLCQKVYSVYKVCFGDSEANLTTLQMLTNIENRMGQLLDNMEVVPKDRILVAERAREKERRLRLREEKVRKQKQQQDERLRKALERAHADFKKPMGKKLMARSQPAVRENLKDVIDQNADSELEKQLYFFS
ncbi:cilia- and flagella-associated protein 100-like [Aplochiton taeniatus]